MAEGLEFAENSLATFVIHWNGLGNVFGHEILYNGEGIIVGGVLNVFNHLWVNILLFGYVFLDVI